MPSCTGLGMGKPQRSKRHASQAAAMASKAIIRLRRQPLPRASMAATTGKAHSVGNQLEAKRAVCIHHIGLCVLALRK